MPTRIKNKEPTELDSSDVHYLLEALNLANESLKKAQEENIALKQHYHLELDNLVAEKTQALISENLSLHEKLSEKNKADQQLYFDAHHDVLTKLPNRAMFSDRLSYALRHLKRHPDQQYAVLFIDLDRFKIINDTLGHHAGDIFLVEIAKRLSVCVRENDVLARLGGDEFVILLDSLTADDAEEVSTRIINSIEQPYIIDSNTVYSSASIGIALCNRHYDSAVEVLRDADAAMYQAKSLGRGRYVFYDESMREKLIATMTLEQELRVAIVEQQFELHYQKISDLNTGQVIGFEGLLRWNHPKKGLQTPSEFLYLAEETGIILAIETWVVEEVARQLSLLQGDLEYQHAFIAINLSGRHLTQTNQLHKLITLIKNQSFDPQRLILEFNEKAFIHHEELALKGLGKLKNIGVKLALDDYASGVSSFSFLHNYPFEFIKLDRGFISTLTNSNRNLPLVKALHDLGEKYGYRLVAEGIETESVMLKLHAAGCDFGQGYHINKPEKIQITSLKSQDKNCA
ncbi:EAL domain-containing protein [Colwellia sp. 4_MG-2023]|jgi:diguanylate cyclase (GGDEF)-like protein|uniref:putative bifunctional diguanylate cyclase/phosphodiesterase n=1 Tax=unclassified Colwellia TaxID=196834 RepID=UPI0026E37FD0|nr:MULTISPECIES: EAL domain-containing protein [unclassified Colwellia]MDO6487769.1 EAL domain-containing protein [Colwellia sp. 6_MG-2023]MDO6506896.1 EAL domain-containing protein [Colwellia sp. 5_MG-2023]MDO6555729.1 EAL domain-containing protein [Colwellia sp. 4_MG-2023]